MTVVIGTAGHIDHGKTALLRTLTGIDADRLPEERRRGMTIDVGYAHLSLPDGTELDFVDVPGHDRLVGNMLVGAGEIDAAMVVVAADDGPRAQTLEHLELLDGLGLRDGIAVVTKTDLVDDVRVAAVVAAVEELLARTSLAASPVVPASSVTGQGIDEVRDALIGLRDRVLSRQTAEGSRQGGSSPGLAIDRVFTVRGRGAVVTGTLRGGTLERGALVRVEPGHRSARVRELQVHGRSVESASGGRTALNLAGIEAAELERGMVVVAEGLGWASVEVSDRLLVALRPAAALAGEAKFPSDRARLRLHLGTGQVDAIVSRGGRMAVALPDGEVAALLRLARPIPVAPGDRFVLRRPSPAATAAGGRTLDPHPPHGVARKRLTPERLSALALARTRQEAAQARLELHGAMAGFLAPDVAAAAEAWAMNAVTDRQAAEANGPAMSGAELRAGLVRYLRRRVTLAPPDAAAAAGAAVDALLAAGRLARDADRIRDPRRPVDGLSPAVLAAMARLEEALSVPAPAALSEAARAAGCPVSGIRALEAAGRIVRPDPDLAWSASAFRELEVTALRLASRAPLAPAALRDATGTSRKYVMVLLEDLDRRGLLRRTAEGHVPGPRAPVGAR
jgi:selenocysteine-specific elongation factor